MCARSSSACQSSSTSSRWPSGIGVCGVHRAIAREHAAPQEVVRLLVDRELEVAEQEPVGDAPLERLRQVVDRPYLDDSLDLLARYEPQLHGGRSRRTGRSRRWPDETARRSRCGCTCALRLRASMSTNDSTSPMNGFIFRPRPWTLAASAPPIVRRSAPVCFCAMPHWRGRARLRLQQVVDERRPHDAGIDIDDAARAIERPHAAEVRHVEHHRSVSELLRTHRVTPAGHADRLTRRLGARRSARCKVGGSMRPGRPRARASGSAASGCR